jgi:hypothetical protein
MYNPSAKKGNENKAGPAAEVLGKYERYWWSFQIWATLRADIRLWKSVVLLLKGKLVWFTIGAGSMAQRDRALG